MVSITDEGMPNKEEELVAAMQLIRSEGVGVRTFHSLLEVFGSAITALERLPSVIKKKNLSEKITISDRQSIESELHMLNKYGGEVIYFRDDIYPDLLRSIHSCPPILTIFGKNKDLLKKQKISVIGSRNASVNSTRFAYKIAKELGEKDYVVVSGLARGVDSYAHMGSLETGTIAVIAGGIDHIYPQENEKLYKQISEYGLIVSENVFGAVAKSQNFPQRNRIVSGLSSASIVVEASLKSGSLITANFALEQNREVFAVPGFPMDTRYSGTNYLIKQGAHLFETVEDLTNVIDGINCRQSVFSEYKYNNVELDKVSNVESSDKDISEICELILSKLSVAPVPMEELIDSIKISRELFLLAVVEMELEDLICRTGNNISLVV